MKLTTILEQLGLFQPGLHIPQHYCSTFLRTRGFEVLMF